MADKMLGNELRAHKNRGFHDGYDAGKRATLQGSYDAGYKKAFEQNFILSTLKGVANALKSSHRNHMQQLASQQSHQAQARPTSAISSSSAHFTPPMGSPASATRPRDRVAVAEAAASARSPMSSGPTGGSRRGSSTVSCSTTTSLDAEGLTRTDRAKAARASRPSSTSFSTTSSSASASSSASSSLRRRQSSPTAYARPSGAPSGSGGGSGAGAGASDDVASTCSSSSMSSSRSSTAGCYSSTNVSISSDHLSLLDSMKFDETSDIESIKKDLIKICRENRLEILAHYVAQIG